MTLDPELHRQAAERASRLGVSLAEYIRRLVAADLDDTAEGADGDISEIFGLGDSGGSDVASQEDAYLAAALADAHTSHGSRR